MFPAQLHATDSDELLRCSDPGLPDEGQSQVQAKTSRADSELARKVDNALWEEPILRAMDYNSIDIRVRNGVVSLYGHVVTGTNGQQAEHAIRGVSGVTGIENHLIADDRLLAEVATGLGSLEHTYDSKFFTGVSHGVVLLSGTVDDMKTRSLAQQYAASNRNVRGVINSVRVRGSGPELAEPSFLQPYIGAEFFFLDGVSGRVRQVIIDPDNRLVAAMTLQGRFIDQRQEAAALGNDGSQAPERTLVIPMRAVRYLTTHSGFLNILSTQTEQYSEFNSAEFLVPPTDWKPPYPYCPSDVLCLTRQADTTTAVPEPIESPIAVAMAHQILKDEMSENDSLGG